MFFYAIVIFMVIFSDLYVLLCLYYIPLIKALRWSGLIFFAAAASFSADRMLPDINQKKMRMTSSKKQNKLNIIL